MRRADQDRALRMRFGFLAGQCALVDEFLNEGVIDSELEQLMVAQQVCP
ncbi:MAG: hypothetical protein ACRDRO_14405 [Pseudonocardiaceae bacterium]